VVTASIETVVFGTKTPGAVISINVTPALHERPPSLKIELKVRFAG
jgi:hypothetical protein